MGASGENREFGAVLLQYLTDDVSDHLFFERHQFFERDERRFRLHHPEFLQ